MRRVLVSPTALALGALLAACNTLTGAGEPEVVAGEGGGAASTLSTTASTTTSSSASSGGSTSASSAGGSEDADDGAPPVPGCGDGERDGAPEECDDGNAEGGDGCSAQCRLECGALETPRLSTETCVFLSAEDDDRSWEDGRTACQDRGGDLLVLHDLDLGILDGRAAEEPLHVGATRAEDGEFEWVDGETVDEATILDEGAGDCLAVGQIDLDVGEWVLLAVPCSRRLRFLCEHDPVTNAE